MRGMVRPGGVDWQDTSSDGVSEIEAHYALETDDGAVIRVINNGFRHGEPNVMQRLAQGEAVNASQYYFRAAPRFEALSENMIGSIAACLSVPENGFAIELFLLPRSALGKLFVLLKSQEDRWIESCVIGC